MINIFCRFACKDNNYAYFSLRSITEPGWFLSPLLHCIAVVHKWYANATEDSAASEAVGGGCCFTLRVHDLFLPVDSYWSDAQVVLYFQHREN